jgi:hypothetical protein
MASDASREDSWTQPKLVRIGQISDVGGNQTAGPQGSGTKS